MLTLLRVPAADPVYTATDGGVASLVNLSTNVMFPANADELLLDGTPANLTADTTLTDFPTITARVGTGAVAVSVVEAYGVECPGAGGEMVQQVLPQLHFKPYQPPGSPTPPSVMRLAIYHSTSVPADMSTLAKCFARVALLWVADHCEGTGCAAALSAAVSGAASASTSTWDGSTQTWWVQVTAATSADAGPTLLAGRAVSPASLTRQVNGQDMTFAPLSVNGTRVVLGQ
jgi:hypothetical protein